MKHEKQFDGLTRPEALREVLKECPAALIQDFSFDDDTQIATWDQRAVPVMDFSEAGESEESFDYNEAMEQCKVIETELNRRIDELDTREKSLQERGYQLDELEKAIEKKQKQCDQSLKEIRKKTSGVWKRTKSFFHGIE